MLTKDDKKWLLNLACYLVEMIRQQDMQRESLPEKVKDDLANDYGLTP